MRQTTDIPPDLMNPLAEQLCADALCVQVWPLDQRQSPNGFQTAFPDPPYSGLYAALVKAESVEARQAAIEHWLTTNGHDAATQRRIFRRIGNRTPGKHQTSAKDKYGFESQDARELMGQELPPLKRIVDQFIYEGSLIVAGSPKTGKSYMMLGISVAIAFGGKALGKFDCIHGEVLYFALEDGQRRVQRRLTKMLQGVAMPAGLHLVYHAPKMDEGFMDGLNAYLDDHPAICLVVVDTLAKIRPPGNSQNGLYQQDYEVIDPFTQLSHDRGICASVVTHTGKTQRDDPMAMISGTQGLTGATDATIVVTRERGTPELHCTVMGRDYDEEVEHILRWDAQIAGLAYQGSAVDMAKNKERVEVLNAIDELGGVGSIQEIATAASKTYPTMKTMLWRMAQDGVIEKDKQNKYRKCRNLVTSVTSPPVVDNKTVTFGGNTGATGLQVPPTNVTPIRPVTPRNGPNVTGDEEPPPEENDSQGYEGYEVTPFSPDDEEDYPGGPF